MADERKENELVLPVGTYATLLSTNNGILSTACGPMKITIQNTDEPVVYDESVPRQFRAVRASEALQKYKVVPKGSYAVMNNPARPDAQFQFPVANKQLELNPDHLSVGKVVNIPGPTSFALWPTQKVSIVPGHQLKTNEYLVVRVYDEEEARKNWSSGVVKLAEKTGNDDVDQSSATFLSVDPSTLVIGQLLLIKGTDVSFYIPPTGVEVLKTDDGSYVRQALTLERLEYCLLANQNGNKRYLRGPSVVFPEPTEQFKINEDGSPKNRAYELNVISGIHLKVIADYEDVAPEGVSAETLEKAGFRVKLVDDTLKIYNHEGDELFITGSVQPIYYPRIEHAILTYGGDKKRSRYHGVQIPSGKARYLMNRLTGKISMIYGEAMLLPDPRTEVLAQRILTPRECRLYYPGNEKVMEYNQTLSAQNSDPELAAMQSLSNVSGASYRTGHISTESYNAIEEDTAKSAKSALRSRSADAFNRSTTFTPPRSLVLDSTYAGAPTVSPWTGYAIQLVNSRGDRRVVIGPQTVNLEFDQRLEVLTLSTSTPKQHDKTVDTVYLKITNNVSDQLDVLTNDLVPVRIRLKYQVQFNEEHKDKWFNVDNYVQMLVDTMRSLISNRIRTVRVQEFYLSAAQMIREWILPEGSLFFGENGMTLYDVNVQSVVITDSTIDSEIKTSRNRVLSSEFERILLELDKQMTKVREESNRANHEQVWETTQMKLQIEQDTAVKGHEVSYKKAELSSKLTEFSKIAELDQAKKSDEIAAVNSEIKRKEWAVVRDQEIHRLDAKIKEIVANTDSLERKSKSIQPQLVEALSSLASTGALEATARHLGSLAVIKDLSLSGVLEQVFAGTGLEPIISNLGKIGKGKVVE